MKVGVFPASLNLCVFFWKHPADLFFVSSLVTWLDENLFLDLKLTPSAKRIQGQERAASCSFPQSAKLFDGHELEVVVFVFAEVMPVSFWR